MTDQLDQTFFGEESVVLPSAGLPAVSTKPARPTWVKTLIVGTVVLLVLMTIVMMFSGGGENKQTQVLSTPTPSPSPLAVSELERRFDLLRADINAADPTQTELSFPPVDFTLDLKDATVLQQQRRR